MTEDDEFLLPQLRRTNLRLIFVQPAMHTQNLTLIRLAMKFSFGAQI